MNLTQFSALMERRARELPNKVLEVKKKVAENVLHDVVTDTPVDTGLAKSNWIVNLKNAVDYIRPAFMPGFKGSTASDNVASTVSAGTEIISGARLGIDIHITNNLPYIVKLNEGYSSQAPSRFVQDAVLRAAQLIKDVKVIVK